MGIFPAYPSVGLMLGYRRNSIKNSLFFRFSLNMYNFSGTPPWLGISLGYRFIKKKKFNWPNPVISKFNWQNSYTWPIKNLRYYNISYTCWWNYIFFKYYWWSSILYYNYRFWKYKRVDCSKYSKIFKIKLCTSSPNDWNWKIWTKCIYRQSLWR